MSKEKQNKKSLFAALRKLVFAAALISVLFNVQEARSECISGGGCYDCFAANIYVDLAGEGFELSLPFILDWFINHQKKFFTDGWFKRRVLQGLAEMTEFLSAAGMYQVQIIGSFFDAKNQQETLRLFQQLQAAAHKDYQPSDDYCWFGTIAKSLAASENQGRYNALAMSERALDRQLGNANTNAAEGAGSDLQGRWTQFITTYCDPKENNWNGGATGLTLACDHDGAGMGIATGATDKERTNNDIDYTRFIEEPRTLEISFDNDTKTPDEEDALAMASNLYGHQPLSRAVFDKDGRETLYPSLRSVAAKRAVAENSFNAIVGMKSSGTGFANYMIEILSQIVPDLTTEASMRKMIGDNPSYYAQLEFLSKKIYESPAFFANLYDTPSNVARKSVALKGIELMLDRALFESELRQEMVMSVLLGSEVRDEFRDMNREMIRSKKK